MSTKKVARRFLSPRVFLFAFTCRAPRGYIFRFEHKCGSPDDGGIIAERCGYNFKFFPKGSFAAALDGSPDGLKKKVATFGHTAAEDDTIRID
jgi:hypothetical protein